MIVRDNVEIQQQVRRLTRVLEEATEQIKYLDKLADSRYEEVDAVDEVENFDKIIFDMRAIMFNTKIELEKVQKAMHKHVAHTLNPIAKTAPKSARKGRGVIITKTGNIYTPASTHTVPRVDENGKEKEGGYQSVTIVHDGKTNTETVYLNGNKQPAKHSTINRKGIIPKGNHYQDNPAHDRPFDESDNDIPF